ANAYLNPFTGLANDKNLTPGKILAKDGMNLCNKGMDVVLETGKAIVPGLGQATDIIDAGKDYYGKAEKMVDKPMEFLADEIKSRGAAYIAGIIDIDSRLDSEGAGKYVKTIAELTLGSDDPQELIERGIDAGIARIKSTDNSIKADIVIAENKQPGAGLPDYIFGIGTYAQEANEFIMNLPSGNWDITAKDNIGYSSVPVSVTVVTQQESTVDVAVSDTSSTSGDPKQGPPTLEDILDSLNMDFSDKPMIHFYFNDGQSAGSTTANEIDHVGYAILWSGNSFSSSLSTAYIDSSYIPHYREVEWDIWGYLTLDTVTWQPVISAECSYTTNSYIGTDNTYLKNELTITYSASTLPLDPWDMDGRYKSSVQFHTRALAESDYENHADYSNDYYVYQDSTTTIVYESHLEGFLNVSSGGFMKIIIQKPLNYIDTVITVY
ncbi:MAG: hypothetical protein K9N05_06050, partial [Candidatus Marinimicrobia bacterium]|nr:hypothetical protein [Candidatus Neomarinimicrobiota bacterium]